MQARLILLAIAAISFPVQAELSCKFRLNGQIDAVLLIQDGIAKIKTPQQSCAFKNVHVEISKGKKYKSADMIFSTLNCPWLKNQGLSVIAQVGDPHGVVEKSPPTQVEVRLGAKAQACKVQRVNWRSLEAMALKDSNTRKKF